AKHIHVKHQQAHAMAAARDDDDDALPPELERVLRPVEPLAPDDEATRACSVCMENRASICFVPCAHQNLCDDCTEDWWYAKPAAQAEWHCPTCRTVIETAVRPYQYNHARGTHAVGSVARFARKSEGARGLHACISVLWGA